MEIFLMENRLKKGLSRKALAELSGVERSQIARIEHGLQDPTTVDLCKLAVALDVAWDDFVDCRD